MDQPTKMTDKNPLAHYSGVLSEAVQESAAVPDQVQIKALMRKHRIWIEHSTLFEDDEPPRELRAVQAEQHQFEAFVQDLIALSASLVAPPTSDYLEGVNIPNLREALIFLGRENGVGEGEVGDKLAQYVNSVVSGVLSKKATLRSTPQAAPIAWPKDAQDVRDFFRSDFITAQFPAQDQAPCDEDRYVISAHDFLSAVNWWANFPHVPREPQAAPAAVAVADERAAFEAWVVSVDTHPLDRLGEGYNWNSIQSKWQVWQAALAATPAADESEVWPCVNIDVDDDGNITNAKLYSPGLPAGNHDVYPVRVPYMDEHTEAWKACHAELWRLAPDFMRNSQLNGIDSAVAAIRHLASANGAAAAPVVLPEPMPVDAEKGAQAVMQLVADYTRKAVLESSGNYPEITLAQMNEAWSAIFGKVRALLATAAGLPMQASWLQPKDLESLQRFEETASDNQGHDIGKAAATRLAGFGCLQSHGFGVYSITDFGHFVLNDWEHARALPFRTQEERDADHRSAIAAAKASGGTPAHYLVDEHYPTQAAAQQGGDKQ